MGGHISQDHENCIQDTKKQDWDPGRKTQEQKALLQDFLPLGQGFLPNYPLLKSKRLHIVDDSKQSVFLSLPFLKGRDGLP